MVRPRAALRRHLGDLPGGGGYSEPTLGESTQNRPSPRCAQRIPPLYAAPKPVRAARRGAGVVERVGLENRSTGNCTVGSNPTLSASRVRQPADITLFPDRCGSSFPSLFPRSCWDAGRREPVFCGPSGARKTHTDAQHIAQCRESVGPIGWTRKKPASEAGFRTPMPPLSIGRA